MLFGAVLVVIWRLLLVRYFEVLFVSIRCYGGDSRGAVCAL